MRRRTRCSVTTAPDDGSRMLEKLSLQQALEGARVIVSVHFTIVTLSRPCPV